MGIRRVWIVEEDCSGDAICEDICPEVFEVNDIAKIKEGVDPGEYEEEIKEAAEECPTECIKYEED